MYLARKRKRETFRFRRDKSNKKQRINPTIEYITDKMKELKIKEQLDEDVKMTFTTTF